MKKTIIFAILQLFFLLGNGQIQQGFKYQAEVRNSEGVPLAEQPLNLRITLESTNGGNAYYTEVHELTTNRFGLISIVIGQGTVTYGSLSEIPWEEGDVTLHAEIKLDGATDFSTLGQSELYPVPYALYAASGQQGPEGPMGPQGEQGTAGPQGEIGPEGPLVPGNTGQTLNHDGTGWVANSNIFNANANVGIGTVTPTEKLEVMGNIRAHGKVYGDNIEITQPSPMEDPIFVVRNSLGKIVFAVYESGVRMYVDDSGKGNRGGFAIGGFSDQTKETGTEYFRVTPDSVRVIIRNQQQGKGNRGGFAIGGFSDQTKKSSKDLLFIAPDSARVYVNENSTKGNRGGFAVGGFSDQTKSAGQKYLFVGRDSARVYVKDSPTKGNRGGFAVGGFSDQTKQGPSNFLDLTPDNYFIGHNAGINTVLGAGSNGRYNSFFGYEAGMKNKTGFQNIFIGYQAGKETTSGSYNTFLGYQSGLANTTGYENAFIGYQTGYSNTTGIRNVFLGWKAGRANTTGTYNIFVGREAGMANTTGTSNVYIGESSGQSNVTGTGNTFIGKAAGGKQTAGDYNVYVGGQSSIYKTSGERNVHIGWHSGAYSAGDDNVLIGYFAGMSSIGSGNVFIGKQAGQNASGWANRLIIENSLESSTPLIYGEFDNKVLKFSAKVGVNTTNTVGYQLNVADLTPNSDKPAIYATHDVTNNYGRGLVASGGYVGIEARNPSATGNYNYGFYTTLNGTATGTRYGIYSSVSGATTNWAGYFAGNVYSTGVFSSSDINLKQNIKPISNALQKVMQLNGVYFEWKPTTRFSAPDKEGKYAEGEEVSKETQVGVIAQEVEKVLPEIVLTDGQGIKSVDYTKLTPLLIQAIKEQQKEIEVLKAEVGKIDALKAELEAIKALISK